MWFSVNILNCRYSTRNISAPIKASLHFSLSRSAIISLDRAEAVIEITEWVEVPKKNVTVDTNSTNTLNSSSEASPESSSFDSNGNSSAEGDAKNSKSAAEEQPNTEVTTEKVLKKKTFRVPLKVLMQNF